MVYEFKGRSQVEEYFRVCAAMQEEGGTLSPGGAAALLGITRQSVHELIRENPNIRAWVFYEDYLFGLMQRAAYLEISVVDLVRHGVRTGRIDSVEDCGIAFPRLAGIIEQAKAELAAGTLTV